MLTIMIPAQGTLELSHLVLDFNGTIATDGRLLSGVAHRLRRLSEDLEIHVLTADTNGSVLRECRDIPVSVHIIGLQDQEGEKKRFVEGLAGHAAVVGNGRNDLQMFGYAALAIAVIGDEGCSTGTMMQSDVVVKQMDDALDLLLNPNRLIATLRN
jgi:soluble P-type ATPase